MGWGICNSIRGTPISFFDVSKLLCQGVSSLPGPVLVSFHPLGVDCLTCQARDLSKVYFEVVGVDPYLV